MNKKTLSIIVVSYNTCDLTLECIRSVFDQTPNIDFELIVIDNNSSDDSVSKINNEFGDKIKLIASKNNVGFAAANNIAAKEVDSEYLLLLNPDTVILDSAIEKIVNFATQHPRALIWGGSTLFADMSLNPTSCWRHLSLWNIFCRSFALSRSFKNSPLFSSEQYGGWNRDSVRHVDIVSGCFLLIKTQLWKELDGFDKDFFMYAEDADLCLRAYKAGARPMFTPDAVLIHYGGASGNIREDKKIRLFKAKLALMRKHWNYINYIIGRILFIMYPLNKILILKIQTALNKEKHQDELTVWNTIWHRRDEWL